MLRVSQICRLIAYMTQSRSNYVQCSDELPSQALEDGSHRQVGGIGGCLDPLSSCMLEEPIGEQSEGFSAMTLPPSVLAKTDPNLEHVRRQRSLRRYERLDASDRLAIEVDCEIEPAIIQPPRALQSCFESGLVRNLGDRHRVGVNHGPPLLLDLGWMKRPQEKAWPSHLDGGRPIGLERVRVGMHEARRYMDQYRVLRAAGSASRLR
jgi:hypothetical protein